MTLVKEDVFGTLRRVSNTQWEILNNASHKSLGLASVQVFADRLQLNFERSYLFVGYLHTSWDEGFAKAAVRIGPSVGLSFANICFYMGAAGTAPVNPGLLSAAGANVWVDGKMWYENGETA